MIKNIVFDFGGVLCDLDFEHCIAAFADLGYPIELLNHEVISSGIFQKYNIGTISERFFLTICDSRATCTMQQTNCS